MLFRKNIDPACLYCTHSGPISDDQVICTRQGVVPAEYHCRRFRYDPLRRIPPAPAAPDFSEFDGADFSLGEELEDGELL